MADINYKEFREMLQAFDGPVPAQTRDAGLGAENSRTSVPEVFQASADTPDLKLP